MQHHATMSQAIGLSVITTAIFWFLAVVACVFAYKRRHHKGKSEIIARRSAWLISLFLAFAPLLFLVDLWINVHGSPIYIHELSIDRTVTFVLDLAVAALLVAAGLGTVGIIWAAFIQTDEQVGLGEARKPYAGDGPDLGGDDPPQ